MIKIGRIIVLQFLLYINAFADSTVILPGGGEVLPASSVSLSLNGLVTSASYSVICYIDTTNPFQYVKFGSNFTSNASTITYYSLNGNVVMQDELQIGQNIVVIVGNFANPSTDLLVFTNLDQSNSFNINNCFALAIQANRMHVS